MTRISKWTSNNASDSYSHIDSLPVAIGSSHQLSAMPMQETFSVSGNIVDVIGRRIYAGRIDVRNGHIERIEPQMGPSSTYLLPGFVYVHVHVESSMLVPSEFARLAVVHGTVGDGQRSSRNCQRAGRGGGSLYA